MKKNQYRALTLSIISGLFIAGCQNQSLNQISNPISNSQQSRSQNNIVIPDVDISGTIQVEPLDDKHVNLIFTLDYSSTVGDFSTQAINCQRMSHIRASVNGIGMSAPIYANGSDATTSLIDGKTAKNPAKKCGAQFTISNIPVGTARIARVEGFLDNDVNKPMPGAIFKTVFNANAGTSGNYEISFRTTPAAHIIEQLIASHPLQASRMNQGLQTFIDAITGPTVSGTPQKTTYTTHPSMVNTTTIKDDIILNQGDLSLMNSADSRYVLSAGTINVDINNIPTSDQLLVAMRDPASTEHNIMTPGSNETLSLTGVSPGNWHLDTALIKLSAQTITGKSLSNIPFNAASTQIIDYNTAPSIALATNVGLPRYSAAPGDNPVGFTGSNLTGIDTLRIGGNVYTTGFTVSESSINFNSAFPSNLNSGPVEFSRQVAGGREFVRLQNFFSLKFNTEPIYSNTFPVAGGASQQYGIAYSNDSLNKSMMVWQATDSGSDIYASIIDSSGTEIATNCNINETTSNNQVLPDVAYATEEGDFLVAWEDQDDALNTYVKARRIPANASNCSFSASEFVIDTNANDHENPALAYGNNKMLVVWQDDRNGSIEIWGNLVNLSGGIDTPGTSFQIANGTGNTTDPRVTYNPINQEFLVVWQDHGTNKIMGQRLSSSGGAQGGVIDISQTMVNEMVPDAAFIPKGDSDGFYMIAWEHNPGGNGDIIGRPFDLSGSALANAQTIAGGIGEQKFPRVSADKNGKALIVYDDNNLGNGVDIAARFINEDGKPLGLGTRINQNSDVANGQFQPVVTYNKADNDFVLMWRSDNGGSKLHMQTIKGYVE